MTEGPGLVVRTGTLDDLDAVMALAMQASEENGFVVPDPEKILNDIYPALLRDRGIMGIIGEPGEAPQGAILLRIGENWYSREPVLEERAVFVHPGHREAKGGRAHKLVDFARRAADELAMPLAIGVLSNHRTKGKIRLYERLFGRPAGVYFLYGAKTAMHDEPGPEDTDARVLLSRIVSHMETLRKLLPEEVAVPRIMDELKRLRARERGERGRAA